MPRRSHRATCAGRTISGTCTGRKGTSRTQRPPSSGHSRLAPNDVPTMIWLGRGGARSGTTGRRRTALHESAVARTSLGRGALWPRPHGAGQKGLRSSRAASRAGAGARQQGLRHPLFAGDGVPWPGRPSQSGIAPAATRHAADSARPVEEDARRVAPQRADLRKKRRRRRQQRRVGRRGGVSQEGRRPGPDAGVAASQVGDGALLPGRPARRVRTVPGGRAAVADASPQRITASA